MSVGKDYSNVPIEPMRTYTPPPLEENEVGFGYYCQHCGYFEDPNEEGELETHVACNGQTLCSACGCPPGDHDKAKIVVIT